MEISRSQSYEKPNDLSCNTRKHPPNEPVVIKVLHRTFSLPFPQKQPRFCTNILSIVREIKEYIHCKLDLYKAGVASMVHEKVSGYESWNMYGRGTTNTHGFALISQNKHPTKHLGEVSSMITCTSHKL